jgi:hypothetical protein
MAAEELQDRSRRETRLLVLVVVVSLAVLLLLARFRFPSASITTAVAPTPGPLAGLAARAAFEDMAATTGTLLTRVSPSLLVVQCDAAPAGDAPPAHAPARPRPGRGTTTDSTPPLPPQFAVALRVRTDLALVHVPAGYVPTAFAGVATPITVVASDPVREIALVRTTPGSEFLDGWPVATFPGFGYVGAVDAMPGGPTIQPVFVGRADLAPDDHWPAPVLTLGDQPALRAGTWLFSMDGRFVGLVARHGDTIAVVPREALVAVVGELVRGVATQ